MQYKEYFKLTITMESGRVHIWVGSEIPRQAHNVMWLLAGDNEDLEVNVNKIESVKSEKVRYYEDPLSS